jgi:hypothetical protein
MCTYATSRVALDGSAKGPDSAWFHVSDATVYFDHPVHAIAEHTLNIDFTDPSRGPAGRVAVELSADSARALVKAIEEALAVHYGPQSPQPLPWSRAFDGRTQWHCA